MLSATADDNQDCLLSMARVREMHSGLLIHPRSYSNICLLNPGEYSPDRLRFPAAVLDVESPAKVTALPTHDIMQPSGQIWKEKIHRV